MSSAPDRHRSTFEARRLSFGAAADLYERARPSYPPEAARFMLGEKPLRVLDLGAGTGKFTRVLAALGHEIVAVEPDPGMREQLLAGMPGLVALAGSAEAIPLEERSVDAVVAAQSFHWFDTREARSEIVRVLAPGGVFAPIWNDRDESVPWVAELGRRVLGEADSTTGNHVRHIDFGPLFGPRAHVEFRHTVEHTTETLLELVRSRSKYLIAPDTERRQMEAEVTQITAGLPEHFELPYVTFAYRAVRL